MTSKINLFNCKATKENVMKIRELVSECREFDKERVDEILIKSLEFYKYKKIKKGGNNGKG